MIDPQPKDIGREVIYLDRSGKVSDIGVVKRITDKFVFVQYRGEGGSKATRREDLEWSKRPRDGYA